MLRSTFEFLKTRWVSVPWKDHDVYHYYEIFCNSIWTALSNLSVSRRSKFSSLSSHQRCSVKKVFLEISQNSQENTCARVSFLIKLQASGSGTGVFLWILWNSKNNFLQNASGRLLLYLTKPSFIKGFKSFLRLTCKFFIQIIMVHRKICCLI